MNKKELRIVLILMSLAIACFSGGAILVMLKGNMTLEESTFSIVLFLSVIPVITLAYGIMLALYYRKPESDRLADALTFAAGNDNE